MWVLILIVVLVVLALMFGGFQKGTRSGSAPRFSTSYPVSVFYSG
jgi:VIT1/CCC1 family predicted Fe2+/Mn2+ transporter